MLPEASRWEIPPFVARFEPERIYVQPAQREAESLRGRPSPFPTTVEIDDHGDQDESGQVGGGRDV